MHVGSGLIYLCILVLGAMALSPVVAWLGIDPLPGDVTVQWQEHKLFLPFTQSAIASASLGLLFLWARK
ncbi:MAG: DUF2905 family protein [Alphaproteobacteria bacterium]|nr:DUF2905 family protein [Alphaproteobacteria bacterium]MBV9693375.1 DUF2905 family protein [Alphaproteobacteria bacterium]